MATYRVLHQVFNDPIWREQLCSRRNIFTFNNFADDLVFLFWDGFAEQFGGESGQKFKRTLFKNTLLAIHIEPLDLQERILKETLDSWKLNYEQVDDILVLGIRF